MTKMILENLLDSFHWIEANAFVPTTNRSHFQYRYSNVWYFIFYNFLMSALFKISSKAIKLKVIVQQSHDKKINWLTNPFPVVHCLIFQIKDDRIVAPISLLKQNQISINILNISPWDFQYSDIMKITMHNNIYKLTRSSLLNNVWLSSGVQITCKLFVHFFDNKSSWFKWKSHFYWFFILIYLVSEILSFELISWMIFSSKKSELYWVWFG